MSHFPIVLIPSHLEKALQAPLVPDSLSLAPPPPFTVSAPKAVKIGPLLLLGIGGSVLAGIIALATDMVLGLAVLVASGISVSVQAWIQRQNYPKQIKAYEKKLAAHQATVRNYEEAKARHLAQKALIKSSDGPRQIRRQMVLKALSQTQLPDGNQSTAPTGLSEGYFSRYLNKYFPKQIRNHLQVNMPGDIGRYYSPDFTYVDERLRLFIDIEVDEPYAFRTNEVTHYEGNDDERDQWFLKKGWVIIRFSEDQIIRFPKGCCKVIANVVAKISGETEILEPFASIDNLPKQRQWTLEEGNQLLIRKHRDKYKEKLSKFHISTSTSKSPKLKKRFTPSSYQQAIFDWIQKGEGDGLVVAVAGSGKSTTLVEAANRIQTQNGIFLAFNKNIAEELKNKLTDKMEARTINSLGFSIVRSSFPEVEVKDYKYHRLLPRDISKHESKTLTELVKLARLTLTDTKDPDAIQALADHYGLDPLATKKVGVHLAGILEQGIRIAQQQRLIDFTDQVWLPTVMNLNSPRYEWIFCDESQDLSPAQLELILRCRQPGGRVLFVGDPHQAIYGFAGADSHSIQKIQERTKATQLPLSICYRCPSSHIKLAQEIVPQIEARDNAPDGVISRVKESELTSLLQPGDLIICRMTAPLVKVCMELLVKGIPANVLGNEIKNSLLDIIQQTEEAKDFRFINFLKSLSKLERERIKAMEKSESSKVQIESYQDKVQTIRKVFETSESESIQQFCKEIESLFEQTENSINLCTVHKAKGLESNRVFILHPDKLPLKTPGQKDWEAEQEMNLKYVALTRAKQELYFIES